MIKCCNSACQQGRACPRRTNDTIGAVAGYVLICVLVVTVCGGLALSQSQDAIDEAVAKQQALACFQHVQMCVAEQAAKK